MCKRSFLGLLFSLLLSFSVHAQAPEPSYFLIRSDELQSIETMKQSWETSRQTWLQQASQLSTKLLQTQTQVNSLNSQLGQERSTYQALKQSFNTFEAGTSAQLSSLSSENANLISSSKALEGKLSFWRLLAICLIGGIVLVIGLYIWLRFFVFHK